MWNVESGKRNERSGGQNNSCPPLCYSVYAAMGLLILSLSNPTLYLSVNTKTIKADIYLAGCIQLVGVILAKAVNQTNLYKSVRKLVSKVA